MFCFLFVCLFVFCFVLFCSVLFYFVLFCSVFCLFVCLFVLLIMKGNEYCDVHCKFHVDGTKI